MSAYLQQMSNVDYFHKLQQRVGHTKDDDPAELSTGEIVKLGRALTEDIVRSLGMTSGKMQQVGMKITALRRMTQQSTINSGRLMTSRRNAGQSAMGCGRTHHRTEEAYWSAGRVLGHAETGHAIADEYRGDLKKLWLLLRRLDAKEIHHNAGHDMALGMWVGKPRQV